MFGKANWVCPTRTVGKTNNKNLGGHLNLEELAWKVSLKNFKTYKANETCYIYLLYKVFLIHLVRLTEFKKNSTFNLSYTQNKNIENYFLPYQPKCRNNDNNTQMKLDVLFALLGFMFVFALPLMSAVDRHCDRLYIE